MRGWCVCIHLFIHHLMSVYFIEGATGSFWEDIDKSHPGDISCLEEIKSMKINVLMYTCMLGDCRSVIKHFQSTLLIMVQYVLLMFFYSVIY